MPRQSLAEWLVYIAFIVVVSCDILVSGPITWYRLFALAHFIFVMIVGGVIVLMA